MKKERRTVSTSKLAVVACSPMAPFPGMKTPFPGMKIDPEESVPMDTWEDRGELLRPTPSHTGPENILLGSICPPFFL